MDELNRLSAPQIIGVNQTSVTEAARCRPLIPYGRSRVRYLYDDAARSHFGDAGCLKRSSWSYISDDNVHVATPRDFVYVVMGIDRWGGGGKKPPSNFSEQGGQHRKFPPPPAPPPHFFAHSGSAIWTRFLRWSPTTFYRRSTPLPVVACTQRHTYGARACVCVCMYYIVCIILYVCVYVIMCVTAEWPSNLLVVSSPGLLPCPSVSNYLRLRSLRNRW